MSTATDADLGRVAVVIPCYRAAHNITRVVEAIPSGISTVVCVNDASDDNLAEVLNKLARENSRIKIITHKFNGGVGAATVSGYREALTTGAEVLVKIDSDGQMNPAFIPLLVAPILAGEVDYAKGNRFFDIDAVRSMPWTRLVGNAGLSFLTKVSTGYWTLFDPTNGYTAIQADVARVLPLEKLHSRYFFESDMLFRLGTIKAVVAELPMESVYGDETSQLSEWDALMTFPFLHVRNFLKRIVYNYFLRGFSAASVNLVAGLTLALFGLVFGIDAWIKSNLTDTPATAGTVMLSAFPLLIGFQLLLSFLQHDIAMTPQQPIHQRISYYMMLRSQDTESTVNN